MQGGATGLAQGGKEGPHHSQPRAIVVSPPGEEDPAQATHLPGLPSPHYPAHPPATQIRGGLPGTSTRTSGRLARSLFASRVLPRLRRRRLRLPSPRPLGVPAVPGPAVVAMVVAAAGRAAINTRSPTGHQRWRGRAEQAAGVGIGLGVAMAAWTRSSRAPPKPCAPSSPCAFALCALAPLRPCKWG